MNACSSRDAEQKRYNAAFWIALVCFKLVKTYIPDTTNKHIFIFYFEVIPY